MSIKLEEEIVKSLQKVPHDFLCRYTARLLCQLAEHGIVIGTYGDVPECIDGFDECGNYFRVEGRKTPVEEQLKLDFSKYDERIKKNERSKDISKRSR